MPTVLRRNTWLVPIVLATVVAVLAVAGALGAQLERELQLAAIYAMIVVGFNISFGYGGQLALGQVAVFAGGAYTGAILYAHHQPELAIALAIAVGVSIVLGVVTGLPGLQWGGWTLALVAFFLVLLISSVTEIFQSETQGFTGIPGILHPKLFGSPLGETGLFATTIGVMSVALLLSRNLTQSRFGHGLLVLKQGPALARSLGLSPFRLRLTAYVIGGIPAGLAGVLYAYYSSYIYPDIFSFDLVTLVLAISVVGGTMSIWGAPVAAAILVIVPDHESSFNQYSVIAYGLFLVIAGLGLSDGLAGLARAVARHLPVPRGTVAAASGRVDVDRQDEGPRPAVGEMLAISGERLSTTGVTKRFGGVEALRGVDFVAEPGRITAVIGANGAGKSTLLNAISGLVPSDSGEVRLGGRMISNQRAEQIARAGVARTFQTPAIPDTLSVLDVAASARIGRNWVSTAAIAVRAPNFLRLRARDAASARLALSFVGLTGEEGRRATDLPLGQRRILEVARCLAAEPAVMLLDEPAAGLDPDGLDSLRTVLVRMRNAGATIVLIEHNVPFVMGVADYVYVMDLGGVLAHGAPDAVRRDERVIASYLGQRSTQHHTLDEGAEQAEV